MIFIDMEGKKPDEVWIKKSDELTRELIRLHKAGDLAARNKLIDDNSDHWGQIKTWLSDLSHGKCWFSEAKDIYSHMDVEHFRPKKEAKDLDGTERDGYWWLAFDYRNYRLCGNVGNRKKGGWFPLQEGSTRSSYDNPREESEDAYLLDPTNPDDVTLIVFDEEGLAQPANRNEVDWEHKRATETIKRLKFNEHEALTEERKRVWQETSRDIECYLEALQRSRRGGNPGACERVRQYALKIRTRTRPHAELSAVASQCVRFRNDERLLRLCA
jgi:uncharacterized protein (TIGR02646 family)